MPSSLICCSDDSSLEPKQLQIKAQGERTNVQQEEFGDNAFFSWTSELRSLEVVSASIVSISTGLCPTVAALASFIDEVESPPSLESFGREDFPLSGILRYFFDLKTPESAGSAAAHQIYSPKTQPI